MKYLKISLFICLLFTWVHAESIKSTTGNIIFDINNDGTSEAKLTSDGLAIGDGLSPSSNLHVQGNVINTGDLVIGGTAGNSTIEIQGTVGYTHQTVSSNTTLSGNSVVLVDTSSDNIIVNLPYAGNVFGRQYVIKKTSTSNEVILNGGGNNIDSSSSYTFTSGNNSSIKVVSNGSQWYVLENSSTGLTANAAWTPAEIITAAWFDADDESTITADAGGNVSQWDDKSGSDKHATSTGTGNPFYTSSDSAFGGMGSIGYKPGETTAKYMDIPTITAAQAYVLVHWQSATFPPDDAYLINSVSPNTKIHGKLNNTTWDASSSMNSGVYYRDGSTSTTNVALPMTSGALWRVPFTSRTTQFTILNDFAEALSNNWDEGAIGEIIFTDGTEDLATQQKIEGYLAHKWGIEENLPSDHPYKNSAP